MSETTLKDGSTLRRFQRLSFFQWSIHLLPVLLLACYTYSTKGPFQLASCIILNQHCKNFSNHHIQGTFERPEFYKPVVDYYAELFTTHEDVGGSLAVFVDGRPVIDLYAGFKDLEGTIPYNNRTLQQVYSSGKAVEGIVIARLVQQGLLDYNKKISEYWPEFAQNGKESVRLVDIMVHEAGVFYLDDDGWDLTWESLADKESFSQRLARQRHHFGGQPTRAYHAVSRGWYLNEIVRRVDPRSRTIGQIAKEELMQEYPDTDLYYGLFDYERDWEERLAPMFDYPVLRIIGRLIVPRFLQNHKRFGFPALAPLHPLVGQLIRRWSLSSKALTPRMAPFAKSFRTKRAHTTESTSFSLKTNAHTLAKLMAMMANKGASIRPGQEPDLLSPEIYDEATRYHSELPCTVTFETIPLSRGGWVKTRDYYGDDVLKGVEVQGWGGAGGSLVLWVEELRIGFSYVTNAFGAPEAVLGDFRGKNLLEKVVRARKQELGLIS
ncbi:MAG: beta-lactamase/transpeptidase-like protein [Benniella sp.]|nr:MAG: beta-lactamase/transpeptidase-like protein [Benniella sp.]